MSRDILRSSRRLRRRRLFFHVLRAAGFFGAALIFLGFFLFLPFFQVREISFFGLRHLSQEKLSAEVRQTLSGRRWFFVPNRNIFVLSKTATAQKLYETYPRISVVVVKKIFPHNIEVSIVERAKNAIWCAGGEEAPSASACFFIDEDGALFQEAPFLRGNALLRFFDERAFGRVGVGVAALTAEQRKTLQRFSEEFFNTLGLKITHVTITDGPVFKLFTDEGWSILINMQVDMQRAIDNLRLAFNRTLQDRRKELEYIDLRFEDKLYYKYKEASRDSI